MRHVFYHNPRCSKSRDALRLLEARGISPEVVLYLETPPNPAELKRLLKKLGLGVRDIIRSKEPLYHELGLDEPGLSDAVLLEALSENPALIERPIFVAGERAALGRPPENVLEILS